MNAVEIPERERAPRSGEGAPRLLVPLPWWARLAVTVAVAPHIRPAIMGDLIEGFRRRGGGPVGLRWLRHHCLSLDLLKLRFLRSRSPRQSSPTRSGSMWSQLRFDLRYAVRTLRKAPGHAVVVILTLAVGIGAVTAAFSVLHRVVLRPLPYPESDALVMVFRTVPRYGFQRSTTSYPDFSDWRAQAASFAGLAGYGAQRATYQGKERAVQWRGTRTSHDLFEVLRVEPVLGRSFQPADDVPGAPATVILGHGLWRTTFGGDSSIIGRSITLGGTPHTVIGVMGAGFAFPDEDSDFWMPLRLGADQERDSNFLTVIGRLRDGVSLAEASSEMRGLAERIDQTAPGANQGYGVFLESRHDFVVGGARRAVLVAMVAVALLLAIACANVANLVLARGVRRRRELAVRQALGAGWRRLVGQLLAENTILALAGGLAGVILAWAILRGLVTLAPSGLPRLSELRLDPMVLGFAALLSMGCSVIVGTLPAFLAGGSAPSEALRTAAPGAGGSWRTVGWQRLFVVGQVVLAMILLVGATLLASSYARLIEAPLGFDPAGVVMGRVAPRGPEPNPSLRDEALQRSYAEAAERRVAFYDGIRNDLLAIPGIEEVAAAYGVPFSRHRFSRQFVPVELGVDPPDAPIVDGDVVTPEYFRTLDIPVIAGRPLLPTDGASSPPVAVVNETAARRFWPGRSPVGQRVRLGDGDREPIEIVGVVADTKVRQPTEEPTPLYYRALRQAAWPDGMYVVIRSTLPSEETVAHLRAVVAAHDRSLPVTDVATADGTVAEVLAPSRSRTALAAGLGLAALLIASIGVFGMMNHLTGTQVREFGVRLALGANPGTILRSVLARGLMLTLVGLALGLAGAAVTTRVLAGVLYGVSPLNPVSFAVAAVVIIACGSLAAWIPARRAARVDPLTSLREE